ncbi:MAG: dTDP-4-dehydrorhamnose 3,5-epimerase family protein [Terriglobales bacterium]
MIPAPVEPQAVALEGQGMRLAVRPRLARGLGEVIVQADAAGLIAGVAIEVGRLWPDDRGLFTELFRFGGADRTAAAAEPCRQVSASQSYPGVIKAMHYHRRQTDYWAVVQGHIQVALYDLRPQSASFGRVNTLYIGEWRPWRLQIPAGVAHGYKVLGDRAALIVYAADQFYDPADEGRLAPDDPRFNYDWELQHK